MLSLRPRGKMNGNTASPLLVTTPNTMMWTGCLVFIHIHTSHGDGYSQWLFYGRNFSLLTQTKVYSVGGGGLSLLKSFAAKSFLLSFMACNEIWPFVIMYEKYQMSSCTTCLIRNLDTPISLAREFFSY